MKKILVAAALTASVMTMSAQNAIMAPSFADNWKLGIDAGVTTPINHSAFFGDMRAIIGLHLDKQITPAFGLGVEGVFGINTSRVRGPQSSTAFDNSYVGAYGNVNLFNLFGGYDCTTRLFEMELQAGAGWGHRFETRILDQNYFATKVGLNFNFNVTENIQIAIKPAFVWDMTSRGARQSSCCYNKNYADFQLTAGVAYKFGGSSFICVRPYDQNEVNMLNATINELRGAIDAQTAENVALATANDALAAQLAACQSKAPEVIKEVSNTLTSTRYVFFKIGSHSISADQQPNVEMIADYMKHHPKSTVLIKGYASPDGPEEVNIRLANQRAEAVKNALISRYKIPASRIKAEGEGIGNMFEEESWNRVAICVLDETK